MESISRFDLMAEDRVIRTVPYLFVVVDEIIEFDQLFVGLR